jgi:AraC family transcriptional regulator of adaptative response / DNA-3-methyladenine glycosylase II
VGPKLDTDACWRAMQSRDRRFEGRFVTGVLTTRIYCRPGCPARLPRRENVRFFACAAAAEESGLRPCLRCRPDASPGAPVLLGAKSTVARALRLIGDGHTDDLDELAARLGVGARHLRRLFAEHLGASPVAVARTQRLHLARKLLDETALPVTEVAFASGFRSVRRFNDAFRRAFHACPTDLRRACPRTDDVLRLRLPYRPPIAWDAILAFLGPRATPGVERIAGDTYARTFALGGARGVVEARPLPDDDAIEIAIHAGEVPPLFALVQSMRALFDLDADPRAIARVLARDPALAPLVRARPGLRVPGAFDAFEVAVRAVLGQQVTVRGATVLAGRLAERWGARIRTAHDALARLFPRPEALADAPIEEIGVPRARAGAIRGLARGVASGAIGLYRGVGDDVLRALEEVKGIGPWTAAYVAMRALGAPDAFPAGDLALRRALDEDDLPMRAERWRPWRAYAAMHLWTKEKDA